MCVHAGAVVSLSGFAEAGRVDGPALLGEAMLLQRMNEDHTIHQQGFRTINTCLLWELQWRVSQESGPRLFLVADHALCSIAACYQR